MNIIVAVDYTVEGRRVVEDAITFAQQNNATMTFLHVFNLLLNGNQSESDVIGASGIETSQISREDFDQWSKVAHQSEAKLQEYVKEAQQAGVTAQSEHIAGQPGPIICGRAEQESADLIIIGRRSQAIQADQALGSVSTYVLNHAPCSVWVVQAKKP